jgi:TPP-dependent 2-oxoacid decarboxylase
VCLVTSERRLVLVTGEGSHQLTAQEISQFGRRGLKPIVFVLNNSGYPPQRQIVVGRVRIRSGIKSCGTGEYRSIH